jgi:uncharacterized protein
MAPGVAKVLKRRQSEEIRMSHIAQELHDAFPEDTDLLRRLKADDVHFQTLAARFEAIDSEARHIDSGEEAASDTRLEEIKKHRLALLDEIAAVIAAARG